MKILKMIVLLMLFSLHAMPDREAENTVGFMMAWPNPDPCDGEECGSSDELMQEYIGAVSQESLS